MQDAAHQRDAEVGLQMLVVIPAERGNPIARAHAKTLEDPTETADPLSEIRVRVTVERFVRASGHDAAPRMHLLGVAEDRRQRERKVHHQAVHGAGLYG